MKKNLFLIFMLTLLLPAAHAQKVRYKDLFPRFAGMTTPELRNALKEYLVEDLEHPNANFRLALVYEQNYKTADPLTQYAFALANAEQAKLRFLKSRLLVDEREVSRNNEYYAPLYKTVDAKGKPFVEAAVVLKKIGNGYDSSQIFINKLPPIYTSFTRSVNFYDKAVKAFAKLNDTYASLDDLYLLYDEKVDKQLEQLKLDFDSARHYLDLYGKLITTYPIAYHHQQYHVRPIITFRLDGLITRMNFLTDNIELWDYAGWVDNIRKDVNGDIAALRSKLNVNEEKIDASLKALEAPVGPTPVPVRPDKQLVFTLNNFDKQSLVLALLDYKNFKQDWLLKARPFVPDSANQLRNAEVYSTLLYANRSADTLLDVVRNRLQPIKIRKHQAFFEKYYGTADGLKKFAADEKTMINSTLATYAAGLKSAVVTMATTVDKYEAEKVVKFGKYTIPYAVGTVTPEALIKGDPINLQMRRNSDGSVYLIGIYVPDKKANTKATYVAHVNPDGKPGWMKTYDIRIDSLSKVPDAHTQPGPSVLTQEGCMVLLRTSPLVESASLNTVVYLNEKGEEKFKIKLKERNYPRRLLYVEKSNAFVLLLKGNAEQEDYAVSEPITLLSINAIGDVAWRRNVEISGTITDLIGLIDGFLVAGNYTVIRDLNGKEFKTSGAQGQCSPYAIRIGEKGDVLRIHAFVTKGSVYLAQVVKVNDASINLLGIDATLPVGATLATVPHEKIIHIMINRLTETIYSTF
ncbi:MAG TPA: hypothetical protein PLX35_08575 [Cyclobacteriaceae bacterium]|nr:hypothetical protein [Cyclobacteriaceae bacterium]